jgi:hypothetical protein
MAIVDDYTAIVAELRWLWAEHGNFEGGHEHRVETAVARAAAV